MQVTERFLKYVSFDTTSDPKSDTVPSTEKQKLLGAYLTEELKSIGVSDAIMDEYGYVYGSIAANTEAPSIGLLAHVDTSNAVSGANIKAQIIKDYDGKDIELSKDNKMEVARFENLRDYVGKTLITTDGTTLLGADDKAGVAVIMEAAQYFIDHPEVPHGKIVISFNPDEEVGRGTIKFDLDRFKCDFAYTLDGAKPDEIEFENFNAASAIVTINGLSTHPGGAKDMMINAINVAFAFHGLLPAHLRPEHTEGYDGFNHLLEIAGDVETVKMEYIIRNHDEALFEKQKETFKECAEFIKKRYGADVIDLKIVDSYQNMKKMFKDKMYIIDLAEDAIKAIGLEPKRKAIRGGTDGASLTYDGICCPNLGAGGQNFHSRYEFCCVEDLEASVNIVKNIITMAVNIKKEA